MRTGLLLLCFTLFSLASLTTLAQQPEQTFVVKKPVKKEKVIKKPCVLLINGKEYFHDVVIDKADLKGLCTLTVLNKQTGKTITPSSFKWKLENITTNDPNNWRYDLGAASDCQRVYDRSLPGCTVTIYSLQYNELGGCFVSMTLPVL